MEGKIMVSIHWEGFKTRIILPSGAGSMLKEHIQGQSVGGS